MRTRSMTMVVAVLTLSACSEGSSGGPVPTTWPPAQATVAWPPQAVAVQAVGAVPDYSARNADCLDCHGDILDTKTGRADVANPHVLHLTSKKTAYKGDNRLCVTCHEMITPAEGKAKKKEGWFVKGGVYHPNVVLAPAGYWKKVIVRAVPAAPQPRLSAVRQAEPHPFKPTLKRLVCAECHGPSSKIKTFYGAPHGDGTN